MASFSGPKIPNTGLVLNSDPANSKNFDLSSIQVLVVAGGGSGGVDNGGGGGAGGLIYNANYSVLPGSIYTVTVGAGGAARLGASDDGPGNNGANSAFGALTAIGGGGGSGWTNPTLPPGTSSYSGGSGAGQSASTGAGNSLGAGTATAGQGNSGGTAVPAYAGGGGGAGSVGGNATSGFAGAGGRGFYSNINGTMTCYAAGGAGGWDVINGYSSVVPFTENGTVKKTTQVAEDSCPANTGHGGNGSNHNNVNSGAGGSGIVIVRYRGPQRATGGTITKVGNDTVHTFTTSGSFLVLRRPTSGEATNSFSDFSSNNNIITGSGSPLYNTSAQGTIDFDGVDDEFNAYPSSGLTGTGSWTMAVWFKVRGAPQNPSWQNVIIDTDATGGSGNMICVDYGGYHGGVQNQLLYTTRPSTGGGYTNLYGPVLTVGTWYHATVVRNGTTDTKLYVNGALYSTYSGNMPTATQPLVRFGRWSDGTNYANISLGPAQIYNNALTAAQINSLFESFRGRYGI